MSCGRPPLEICKGINDLERVILRGPRSSSVEILLYGGQVISWKNADGEELLFLSTKTTFKPPKPIRGGIPICFPVFSEHGCVEQQAFARNRLWSVDSATPPFGANPTDKTLFIDLILRSSKEHMKIWPHNFELRLRIALGSTGNLMMTCRVRNTNTDGKPFAFTFALRNHFRVSDVGEVRIEGLETLYYLDNLQEKELFTDQGDAVSFDSEVDKVYINTPSKIAVIDHGKRQTVVIRKDTGLPDVGVWNPWEKKAKEMCDFEDEEYEEMVCVEPAVVEKPITLKPGEEWKGRQELSFVPSSYCSD
ncbi:putative enzyme related to aldose 1-epimerase [Handroanthus impetiginosus]|uniref:glucose-6-phosphate 1-epimerase n=1 Tax=Handroanthus impetiginosus TaxID=429701 RepID=A0A2G9HB06_9LAMI|nr:putative enzyme related to aldose 1-epimerase [Handroanthus impetiginosus]